MNSTLSPAWIAWPETRALINAFAAGKSELRFVGGGVRDALLGRPVSDVDAATPLLPEAVMALLEKSRIRAIPTGIDHGTVTAIAGEKHFEITTLRKDVTTDGRHAEVAYTDDWKQDAARRDFTMNALYLSPQGELFDYFGGAADARAGQVRFIGDAPQRIAEDYLRILRFFRFYAWYGKGEPDASALAACAAAAGHIETLSGERIKQEMMKLLSAPDPSRALMLMQEHKIAPHVFGGDIHSAALMPVMKLEREITISPRWITRLAAITRDIAFGDRWRLSNQEAVRLTQLQRAIPPGTALAEQKKLLRKTGGELFVDMAMVSAARTGLFEPYKRMVHLPEEWQAPVFPINGSNLIALGIAPGKDLGELLRQLEEKWEASDYKLTKEELLKSLIP